MFRVEGLGFRVLGFRVLGFKVLGMAEEFRGLKGCHRLRHVQRHVLRLFPAPPVGTPAFTFVVLYRNFRSLLFLVYWVS